MKSYRLIPTNKKLHYLPAIKQSKGIWVYIPALPADPEADQDQEPIVTEDS